MAAPAASSSSSPSAGGMPVATSDTGSSMGAATATPPSVITPSSYTTAFTRFPTDAVGATAAAARNTDQSITLRESISKELSSGTYSCCVCHDVVGRDIPVWHCGTCFRISCLSCAVSWAESCAKSAERGASTGFRSPCCGVSCPTPKAYVCFCGKTTNPKPDPFLVPHSCGAICGRKREHGCPHGTCNLPCHPGRCQPCGQTRSGKCPCEETTYSWACGTPDPRTTCQNDCGKPLDCGNHLCAASCHHGACKPCDVTILTKCFCGKSSRELGCAAAARQWQCDTPCGKRLDCGCKCAAACHPDDVPCMPCPRDPRLVASCPCGKRALSDPEQAARAKCSDPIPVCGRRCGLKLACGVHECEQLCHDSECAPCTEMVRATCSCGLLTERMPCSAARDFHCQRSCGQPLSCGRHFCKVPCCQFRKQAGGGPTATTTSAEARRAHACGEICGRQLMCGHRCMEPCHQGACPPCPNIIMDNLSCGCGAQFRLAPLPCGTVLPPCTRDCRRPRECGHDSLKHSCHHGECPPCPEVVERSCAGGHMSGIRVACSTDPKVISCGQPCGAAMPGCGHPCARKCHDRAGAAPDDPTSLACILPETGAVVSKRMCSVTCGRMLPCGHRCEKRCHFSHAAFLQQQQMDKKSGGGGGGGGANASNHSKQQKSDDDNDDGAENNNATRNPETKCPPCSASVEVPCSCGIQMVKFSCRDHRLWREQNPDKQAAPCADDCHVKRREAALRPARAAGLGDTFGTGAGSAFLWTPRLWSAARSNPDMIEGLEKGFKELLSGKDNFKKLPPMGSDRRRLAHEMAWLWNVATESVDQEPLRAVLLTRTPASRPPQPLLSDAIYTSAQSGHSPMVLFQTALANRSRAQNSVIVFEGSRLTEVDLTVPLRPFVGRVALVSSADFLRGTVQHLAQGVDKLFRRGEDTSVILAVFSAPGTAATAFSHLRKTMCKITFHMFGSPAPPRNVEDSRGRLQLAQKPAVAFTDDLSDSLWETGVGAADAAAANAWNAARHDAAVADANKGAVPVVKSSGAAPPPPAAGKAGKSPPKSVWGAPSTGAGGAASSSWATMLRGSEAPPAQVNSNNNSSSSASDSKNKSNDRIGNNVANALNNMPALGGAQPNAETAMVACPKCTFLNSVSRNYCEMCDSAMHPEGCGGGDATALQTAAEERSLDEIAAGANSGPLSAAANNSNNSNNNDRGNASRGNRNRGDRHRGGGGGGGGGGRGAAATPAAHGETAAAHGGDQQQQQQQRGGGRRRGGGGGRGGGGRQSQPHHQDPAMPAPASSVAHDAPPAAGDSAPSRGGRGGGGGGRRRPAHPTQAAAAAAAASPSDGAASAKMRAEAPAFQPRSQPAAAAASGGGDRPRRGPGRRGGRGGGGSDSAAPRNEQQ